MKATVCFLLAIAQLTCGLEIEREPENPNNAYVTMWINKAATPAHFFQKVLSKGETVYLNSAPTIGDTGLPALNPFRGAPQNRQVFLEEGTPKLKQRQPLRPRNSNFNGIYDIARNLREVGAQYPLVVLTNAEEFKNETLLAEHPNLKVVWVKEEDFLKRHCKIGAGHELHFQKLAIWKLTDYDKLMWLDTDIAFSSNVDYAFKQNVKNGARIYGQIDDYHCDNRNWSPTSGGICSGMLLFKPSTLHFQGLMMTQSRMQSCWGDQSIISQYFSGKGRESMQLQRNVINFARCKDQGKMDAWHFSGSPNAKRVGDPDTDMKRSTDGHFFNVTAVKLKAQEEAAKKAEEAAKNKAKKLLKHKGKK